VGGATLQEGRHIVNPTTTTTIASSTTTTITTITHVLPLSFCQVLTDPDLIEQRQLGMVQAAFDEALQRSTSPHFEVRFTFCFSVFVYCSGEPDAMLVVIYSYY